MPFLGEFVTKFKTNCLSEICYLYWFEYVEFNGNVHFFCFQPEIPFLGKLGPKSQNCQFKLKSVTKNNSNTQKSMMVFTYSVFYFCLFCLFRKYPFWPNLVPKFKTDCLKWNLILTISHKNYWDSLYFHVKVKKKVLNLLKDTQNFPFPRFNVPVPKNVPPKSPNDQLPSQISKTHKQYLCLPKNLSY